MYLTRHSEMIADVPMDTLITIIGAGSIGSYTALALAKLGFTNIIVADDGIVEEENIAPQFYRPRDIGKLKVECLKRAIKDQTNTDIIAIPCRIEEYTTGLVDGSEKVLILAVDSMSARKLLSGNLSYGHLVDARMAIEFLTVISFKYSSENKNYDFYRGSLFSDADAVQEMCTNKAISYTSLIAGGLVAKCTLDLLKGVDDGQYQTVNYDINNFDMMRLV